MAVKFTEKQWTRMVAAVEQKFGAEGDASKIVEFIANYKAPRSSRAEKPSGGKRVANAYVLWTKENREKIVTDHFDGVAPKASEVTKKASSLWNEMSEEDKQPWKDKSNELKVAAGLSPSSSPSSAWKFEKKVDVDVPTGWSGPFTGKYLARYAAKGRGVGRFATFEEAVEAANALGGQCGGITLEQKAYTLRVGNDPIRHENPGQSSYSEASWTKDDFEPEVAPKATKKKTKKAAKKVDEENEGGDDYNAETEDEGDGEAMPALENNNDDDEDEDDEETEVERWEFNGKIYLLDPKTNEVYDASSCELIGKKGEGEFAETKKVVKKVKVNTN